MVQKNKKVPNDRDKDRISKIKRCTDREIGLFDENAVDLYKLIF